MDASFFKGWSIKWAGLPIVGALVAVFTLTGIATGNDMRAEEYMTIAELGSFCAKLGHCDSRLCCEGKHVKVKGFVDRINIFNRKTAPNLPYQKFRILDSPEIPDSANQQQDFLEIYPAPERVDAIFEKVDEAVSSTPVLLGIHGQIKGFDAPTNMGVFRLYNLMVDGPDDIVILN